MFELRRQVAEDAGSSGIAGCAPAPIDPAAGRVGSDRGATSADATSSFVGGLLPGLCLVGLGARLVFAAVAGTAMNGIPAQHTDMASGFLMTGHEVGAALGVAVVSAVAGTAGNLTAAAFALVAAVRMPTGKADAAHMHLH